MKSKILDEFDSIMMGDYGNAILYTGVVGLALSDKFPTPSPLLATFHLSKYKKQYETGDIDVFEYKKSVDKALNMYKYLWWGGVFATIYFTEGNVYAKAKMGGILLGIGLVASLLVSKPKIEMNSLIEEPEKEEMNFNANKQAYRRGNLIKFV